MISAELNELLWEHYELSCERITALEGYDSQNYKLETLEHTRLLKIYAFSDGELEYLNEENRILLFLSADQAAYSKPIANSKGDLLTLINYRGAKYILRLLTFLSGEFLSSEKHTMKLIQDFGGFMAKLDMKLLSTRSHPIQNRIIRWDLQHVSMNRDRLSYIENPMDRNRILFYLDVFEEKISPHRYSLRRSIIHNDANDWNVLCRDEKVIGLIDFGDMVNSYLLSEVAIALTYVLMNKSNPGEVATWFLKSYNNILKLEKIELELLYYFIGARLCTSLINSAYTKRLKPESDYIGISEAGAWDLINTWIEQGPILLTKQFLLSCGYSSEAVPPIAETIKRRQRVLSKQLSISYDNPIHMDSAVFQYMYDRFGNAYLDAYNNIPIVGHSHPKIVAAAKRQMSRLNTNTRYLYDAIHEYSEKLLSYFPEKLNRVFYVNSGSAANDLAIRIAKEFTGNNSIVVLEHGYHGNLESGIDISHYKYAGPGGKGENENTISLPMPDTYRGEYAGKENAGLHYATGAINKLKANTDKVACLICEPIIGCGGQVPLADGYLESLFPVIRTLGGLCIVDEVQTGFGRVGKSFWAYETYDVIPDIIVLGKPIANGHPMGAVITRADIAEKFNNGMEFFSSFGGNPVSCEIALAVISTIEEEGLKNNALEVGQYFKQQLNELKQRDARIGDVRGEGLFLGVDLVQDGTSPATGFAKKIKNEMRYRFILTSTDGPGNNVLKIKPPLCFSKKNVDRYVEVLGEVMRGLK